MSAVRVSRREALRFLAAGASLSVLAACGSAAPAAPSAAGSGPAATGAIGSQAAAGSASAAVSAGASARTGGASAAAKPAGQGSAQPKAGGTLRTVIPADIATLDPQLQSPGAADTMWLVYEPLIAYDLKHQLVPMLAESWDVSGDYKQVKLNIRKGVQFHSGRELTADDVVYSLLRVRDPKVAAGGFVVQSKAFSSIEAADKYTVVLRSTDPQPLAFDLFERLDVVDKATIEGPDAKTKANGTGPFTFVEWVQGDHVSVAKNKNYWQTGRPYLDGVKTSIVKDSQALVAQLESGAFDMARSVPLRDYARLIKDPKFQAIANQIPTGFHVLGVNTLNKPLDDKRVRQALNYAIDRKRFVDTVLLGIGEPEALPWDASSPAYEPDKNNRFAFDLDKAKALLSQAGVSGFSLDMLPLPGVAAGDSFSQIYQADLAKLGITLNIKQMELATWFDQVNNRKYNGMYYTTASRPQSPSTAMSQSRIWDPTSNNSGYANDTYKRLIDTANTKTDAAKLKQELSQLNDILLDESFTMALAPNNPTTVVRSNVGGASQRLLYGVLYSDLWLQ
jgi:peptide/nickel transport system substrate-binding protein